MTRRPAFVYAIFAACLLLAGLGASLLSWTVVERDTAQAVARREALLEENIRLALWRIDSEIATLIATENARPYFDYAAFRSLTRAYTKMTSDLGRDELVEPSPLLAARPKYVRLHFQFADGRLSSPQVPADQFEERAAQIVGAPALVEAKKQLTTLSEMLDEPSLVAKIEDKATEQVARKPPPAPEPKLYARSRGLKNEGEFWKRSQSVAQASTYNVGINNGLVNPLVGARGDLEGRLTERSLTALWVGDELVLARRITVGSRSYLQGLWLDWPTMRAALRDSIEDLLPLAELEAVRDRPADESENLLASLPLRLNPGDLPYARMETSLITELSLVAVWMGFLIAGAAMLALMIGAMSLSERRSAFVSAVTHELRTPLTTFRMYTEMLSDGRVRTDEKKQRYLDTLRREAVRLAHLVENVLAYSRIERGRAAAPPASTSVDELLVPMLERLQDRAAQAGMEVVYEPPEDELSVVADRSAVEHILFNLVDNACKYASSAEDKRIHIEPRSAGARVYVRVRDHGPGIQGEERRTLFSPFSKSAQRAALSAPGVGLGLALSRRLAKEMGARLTYADDRSGGASFTLSFGRG